MGEVRDLARYYRDAAEMLRFIARMMMSDSSREAVLRTAQEYDKEYDRLVAGMHEGTEEGQDVIGDSEADAEEQAEQEVLDSFLHGVLT